MMQHDHQGYFLKEALDWNLAYHFRGLSMVIMVQNMKEGSHDTDEVSESLHLICK